MILSLRDIELLNGMIEVQVHHAEQCKEIINRPNGNITMATKQRDWDMERVYLLLIEKLIELTPIWSSPLTGTIYHGFVKDGCAIVMAKATKCEN
jgi:hypothetical protein